MRPEFCSERAVRMLSGPQPFSHSRAGNSSSSGLSASGLLLVGQSLAQCPAAPHLKQFASDRGFLTSSSRPHSSAEDLPDHSSTHLKQEQTGHL